MSLPKQGNPTDIADRLRVAGVGFPLPPKVAAKLYSEAADEIEKLRMAVAVLENQVETLGYELKEKS